MGKRISTVVGAALLGFLAGVAAIIGISTSGGDVAISTLFVVIAPLLAPFMIPLGPIGALLLVLGYDKFSKKRFFLFSLISFVIFYALSVPLLLALRPAIEHMQDKQAKARLMKIQTEIGGNSDACRTAAKALVEAENDRESNVTTADVPKAVFDNAATSRCLLLVGYHFKIAQPRVDAQLVYSQSIYDVAQERVIGRHDECLSTTSLASYNCTSDAGAWDQLMPLFDGASII
jgi:hypothetical protein